MKKYLLNFLFIITAACVFATPAPYAHIAMYNDVNKPFLEHLVKGERATYQICTPNFEEDNEINNIQFLIGLLLWLQTTEDFIKERENGEKEFKDILKIIDDIGNFQSIERIPCKYSDLGDLSILGLEADLNVIFAITPEGDTTGSYDLEHQYMRLNEYIPLDDGYYVSVPILPTILHELGHVFGLADKYSGARHYGSYIYNSLTNRPSIMDGSNGPEEITCDDIDGFITSIDRIRKKKRTFKSFCNDGIVLVNGKAEAIKGGYVYNYKDSFSYKQANYDANITISYEDKSVKQNSYIMDMVLENFASAKGSFSFLKDMGFDTKNLDLRQNVKVLIHAPVKEMPEGNRKPIGLTTLILKVNDKTNQVVNMFYSSKNTSYTRTSVEPYKFEIIQGSINLPIMYYSPDRKVSQTMEDTIVNYMEKYDYTKQFPFKDRK